MCLGRHTSRTSRTKGDKLLLLVDVIIIVAVARLLGSVLTRLGQPAVIGEILAGIVLGPTLMGESLNAALFPADVRPVLSWLANVSVIVFLFFTGLELDRSQVQRQRRVVVAVSLGSLALPFALGVGLAPLLLVAHPAANPLAFILFMGTALSVAAFPVLARVLTDRGMVRTPLGVLALTIAAVIDVGAWVLLAVVTAVAGAESQPGWRLALVVPYLALMMGVVRPLFARFADRFPKPRPVASAGILVVIALGLAGSASLTSWLGIHAIFGAFIFGAVMPRSGLPRLRERVLPKVEQASAHVLLPIFFAVAGFSVNLSTMDVSVIGELALVLVVSVAGKFTGAFAAAKAVGVSTRRAAVLSTLINTRGMTDLIVLVAGLNLGILNQQTFTMMVTMALITTALVGVVLRFIQPESAHVSPATRDGPRRSCGSVAPAQDPPRWPEPESPRRGRSSDSVPGT